MAGRAQTDENGEALGPSEEIADEQEQQEILATPKSGSAALSSLKSNKPDKPDKTDKTDKRADHSGQQHQSQAGVFGAKVVNGVREAIGKNISIANVSKGNSTKGAAFVQLGSDNDS